MKEHAVFLFMSMFVMIAVQKEHGECCPGKQDFTVIEDKDFINAGRASARYFLRNTDQPAADPRFDVIDRCRQRHTVASGRKTGRAGSSVSQREQRAAVNELVHIQDLFIDIHFDFRIAFSDLDDTHIIAL